MGRRPFTSKFNDANGKPISAYSNEYRKRYMEEYYLRNKEKASEYGKIYNQTIKGKYSSCKKGAISRKLEFSISIEFFQTTIFNPCWYCGLEEENGVGIDRIDSSVGYIEANCNPCCYQCNIAKNVLSEEDFLSWVRRVYRHRSAKC